MGRSMCNGGGCSRVAFPGGAAGASHIQACVVAVKAGGHARTTTTTELSLIQWVVVQEWQVLSLLSYGLFNPP